MEISNMFVVKQQGIHGTHTAKVIYFPSLIVQEDESMGQESKSHPGGDTKNNYFLITKNLMKFPGNPLQLIILTREREEGQDMKMDHHMYSAIKEFPNEQQ